MKEDTQRLLPNWVDGMKLNARHFNEMQDGLLHLMTSRRPLKAYEYGLMKWENALGTEWEVMENGLGRTVVQLNTCHGITQGGTYVYIAGRGPGQAPLKAEYDLNQSQPLQLYVVLTVSPYERMPVGEPDGIASPLRLPYTLPAMHLSLLTAEQITGMRGAGNSLVLGRLRYADPAYEPDGEYLPPCSTINSHGPLLQRYGKARKQVGEIGEACVRIMEKVVNKNQMHPLAVNLRSLAEALCYHVGSERFKMNALYPSQPPVEAIASLNSIAGLTRVFLHTLSDRDREELLGYLTEWTGTAAGQIEAMINAAYRIDYNHDDLSECWHPLAGFIETLSATLVGVSKLDLIGQSKDGEEWMVMGGAPAAAHRPAPQPPAYQRPMPPNEPIAPAPRPAPPAPRPAAPAPAPKSKPVSFPGMSRPKPASPAPQAAPPPPAPAANADDDWGLL